MLKSALRLSGLVEFARISCSFQPHFNVTEKIIIAQVRERTQQEEDENPVKQKSENLLPLTKERKKVCRDRQRASERRERERAYTQAQQITSNEYFHNLH